MSDHQKPAAAHNPMGGVIPYLAFNGQAGAAADLYIKAFGGEDDGRMPNPEQPGRFMHVQIKINGGVLMLCDHMEDKASTFQGGHLQLVVDDGQAWWDRAVAAGLTVVSPYELQFWGDHWGLMRDPFGISWAVMQIGDGAQA